MRPEKPTGLLYTYPRQVAQEDLKKNYPVRGPELDRTRRFYLHQRHFGGGVQGTGMLTDE